MKKSIYRVMFSMMLLVCSSNSFAFGECIRSVTNIWSDMQTRTNGNNAVYVCFETGSCIFKYESQLSDGQMARLVSMALTAKTTGKKLRVRYPEDEIICPPQSVGARNDFSGIWLVD